MARQKTSREGSSTTDSDDTKRTGRRKAAATEIPEAEVVAETPPIAHVPEAAADAPAQDSPAPEAAMSEPSAPEAPVPDAPQPEASAADTPEPAPAQSDTEATQPDAPAPAQPQTEAPKPDAPAPKQSASILPMLLGGAFAAALGYGAHMLTQSGNAPDMQAELAQLRSTIDALPAPAPAFDPSPLVARLDALETAQPDTAALDDLTAQLGALAAQVTALDAATQDTLRAASAAQQDALAAFEGEIARIQADLDDLRALATERVEAAQAARDTALASAALDQLRAALVTGAPFAGALAQITGAGFSLPEPLAALPNGVATIEALAESYTDAARAGLRASLLDAPASSTTERLGNFLRAQVGAMSTTPRAGDDVDAILSRGAAAMLEGDVATALAELAPLPEAARAPMADWIAAATARLDASAALDALAAQIAP